MSAEQDAFTEFRFEAEVIYWQGPSPFFFVAIPMRHADELRQIAKAAIYGGGMIPMEAEIGGVAFTTALFPRDDTYLPPLKVVVRNKAGITSGDQTTVKMAIQAVRR